MPATLPNIKYVTDKKNNPILDSDISTFLIPFNKEAEYFDNIGNYTKFLKACETQVRNSPKYKAFKKYVMTECKLNRCQILRAISEEDVGEKNIEMHHGPIFTLFDICAIVLEYFLIKKWKITTFKVADQVLTEHLKNRVQVVMLSKTMHDEVHNRNIFIHYKQAYGPNFNEFLDKYSIAMSDEYKLKYNNYIDRCLLENSNDYGALELSKKLFTI